MLSPRRRTALLAAILMAVIGAGAVVLATSGGPSHRATAPRRALSHPGRPLLPLSVPASKLSSRAPARFAPRAGARPQISARRHRTRRFGTTANPVNGETFSTTTGTWTGNPSSYGYQWLDCDSTGAIANCIAIATANASTYTLVSSDIGHTIRVAVTATNQYGFNTQDSAATGVVAASATPSPQNTIAPAVTGTATQGQVLSTTTGTWSGAPTSYAYQWQDCDAQPACTDIAGATSSTYTLAAAQVNHTVRATVIALNASGAGTAYSNSTAGVAGSGGGTGGTWDGTEETGSPSTLCDYWASTTGSNANLGTGSGPGSAWQTIDKMVSSLPTGKTGCLEAGSYGSTSDNWSISTPSVTITAAPGAAVTIHGHPTINPAGTGVTLSYLNIDEDYIFATSGQEGLCASTTYVPLPLEVNGNNDTITHDNIYQTNVPAQDRTNGIGIGWNPSTSTYTVTGVTVSQNRIHDFGNNCGKAHGIYGASFDHSTINDNWFWGDDAGGACMQFYDGHAAPYKGPHDLSVFSNVCDDVNQGFFLYGETPYYQNIAINHTIIRHTNQYGGYAANSGTNSTITFTNNDGTNIADGWPCGPAGGCGNVAQSANITTDPGFSDASSNTSHDYRVSAASPASSWGMWDGDVGAAASSIVGTSSIGATVIGQDADYKRANCYTAGATGTVPRITAYLSATGVAGTQKIQAVVYSYSAGPSALLGQSTELTFTSTSAAGWYDLPLTAPLSITSGTTYCLALLTGATTQVAAVRVVAGGTLYYNPDTYPGPSDPFGSSSTGTQTMSMYMAVNTGAASLSDAHVPTWDRNGALLSGAPTTLIRQWATVEEVGGGGDSAAAAACHSGGITYCQQWGYIDTNVFYPAFPQSGGFSAALQETWYQHVSGSTTTRIRTPDFSGGFLLNPANAAAQAWWKNNVNTDTTFYGPGLDGLFSDDLFGIPLFNYFDNSNRSVGVTLSNEIATESAYETAHLAMNNAITKPDGSTLPKAGNGIPACGNPFEATGQKLGLISGSIQGLITEGCPIFNGAISVFGIVGLLDDASWIDAHTSGYVVLLSEANAAGNSAMRRVQQAVTMLVWDGANTYHGVLDWADLEQDTNNVSIWPEEGIVPGTPVQTMGDPGSCGFFTSGTGSYCSSGGHNDVQVASGVFRREFTTCYNQGVSIGRCAVLVNQNGSPSTVSGGWLTQSYGHSVTFNGGDVQSGGSVNLTGATFTAGSTAIPAGDALILTQ